MESPSPNDASVSLRPVGMIAPQQHAESQSVSSDDRISAVLIISWNVDMMASECKTRLRTALAYLREQILPTPDDAPCCIMLQEVDLYAFPVLREDDWVKRHFFVVPSTPEDWPGSGYGNVTLISRALSVVSTGFVDFQGSRMGRGALVVDIALPASADASRINFVRFANVHLESLGSGTSQRKEQLKLCARLLSMDDVSVGFVCGDMNAIRESDKNLPESLGLIDAWKGGDEDEAGFTWGWQPKQQYPPGRLVS